MRCIGKVALLLVWLSWLCYYQCIDGVPCNDVPPDGEIEALQALYTSTNGDQWDPITSGQGWNFSAAEVNPCDDWQGVLCRLTLDNSSCVVYSLNLVAFDLQGTLPTQIGQLPYLTSLVLSASPNLVGSIPSSIANLTSLTYLQLAENSLTGTIPDTVVTMTALQTFNVYQNAMNGTIPQHIGHMSQLVELYLGMNLFTGTLPPSITQLHLLQDLYLFENHFHGPLPEDIDKLINLNDLRLYENAFSGTLPAAFANLTQLKFAGMHNNMIRGTLPASMDTLVSLVALDLSYNMLTGSLPATITALPQLEFLLLMYNKLRGTIPKDIGNMTSLDALDLANNDIVGSIPESIVLLQQMQYLYLADNVLEGSIPENIGNMTQMLELTLETNLLTGTIPNSVTRLALLQHLHLFDNLLHGDIPVDIGNLSMLEQLYLFENLLSGTIPSSISDLKTLQYFYAYNNQLHGGIQAQLISGSMTELLDVELYNNELSGSWAAFEGNPNSKLDSFGVSDNYFSGVVQFSTTQLHSLDISDNFFFGDVAWLEHMPAGETIVFSNNMFTGTVPTASQLSTNLTYFQAQSNFLTGSITGIVNPQIQTKLKLFDLGKNAFTGPIPSQIFQYTQLVYCLLAENCLTGTIPSTVCERKETLQALVLDGLHAAGACQQRLFDIPQIRTLAASQATQGSIPACLFGEMDKLQILHMSGNGLTGSLPDKYDALDTALQQLSLSHNSLTGTIPEAFQRHSFTALDLSFNKLTGTLTNDIHILPSVVTDDDGSIATSSGLTLNNNRLSGNIPASLLALPQINVLAGNMFDCDDADRDATLPKNDEEFDTYICGSDETNNTMISYVVVVVVVVAMLAAVTHSAVIGWNFGGRFGTRMKTLIGYATIASTSAAVVVRDATLGEPITIFLQNAATLQRYVCLCTAAIVVVFMLTYGILGVYFSTFQFKYVWAISAGYLSGVPPAVCLFVVMTLLLIAIFLDSNTLKGLLRSDLQLVDNNCFIGKSTGMSIDVVSSKRSEESVTKVNGWLLGLYLLLNVILVMTVNSSYVSVIISGISTSEQFILTVAMSIFKDGWRFFVMSAVRWNSLKEAELSWGSDSVTSWLLAICLFNNIIAPCIATAMVNTDCFYYSVVQADDVVYNDEVSFCQLYYIADDDYDTHQCATLETISLSTSYQPPYIYTYQCSSTLLSLFAPVWIYMFLFGSILTPLMNLVAYIACNNEEATNCQSIPINWMLLLLSRARARNKDVRTFACFDYITETVILCNNFAIVLCFGVLFPPIAIVGCIAIAVQTMMQKVFVLDLVLTAKAAAQPATALVEILAATEAACNKFPHTYVHTVKNVVLYVSVVWGVFLWDIMGDDLGLLRSMWVFLVTVLVGLLLRLQYYLRDNWAKANETEQTRDSDDAMHSPSMVSLEMSIASRKTEDDHSEVVENPLRHPMETEHSC